MKYANISNCPLENPFFASDDPRDGEGRCTVCPETRPYFDIKAKICVSCPKDYDIDKKTHTCQPLPQNSNYEVGENYVLAPLKLLPLPDKDLTYCENDKPFFDGRVCVSCPLPHKYWNISAKTCNTCPD